MDRLKSEGGQTDAQSDERRNKEARHASIPTWNEEDMLTLFEGKDGGLRTVTFPIIMEVD